MVSGTKPNIDASATLVASHEEQSVDVRLTSRPK